jgi:hypothetical protein
MPAVAKCHAQPVIIIISSMLHSEHVLFEILSSELHISTIKEAQEDWMVCSSAGTGCSFMRVLRQLALSLHNRT